MSKTKIPANAMVQSIALFRPNRPVVVSTLDRDGTPHLAPFSWCKPVSAFPPLVTLALLSSPRKQHSLINIEREKEFVVNLPGFDFSPQLVRSSYRYPVGVRKAGIVDCTFGSSQLLRTPVIEQCKANVECKLVDTLITGDHTLLVGEVVAGSYLEEQFLDGVILDVEHYPACMHLGSRVYQDRQVQVFMHEHDLMAVAIPYDLSVKPAEESQGWAMQPLDSLPAYLPPPARDATGRVLETYGQALSCPTGLIAQQEREQLIFADWAEGVVYRSEAGSKPEAFVITEGMPTDVCTGSDGAIFIADMGRKTILRVAQDGNIEPVIKAEQGSALQGPLACAVNAQGSIYFTDADGMQPTAAEGKLYLQRKDGQATLLLDKLIFPSGLALTRDEKTLYLAETFASRVRRISLDPVGAVAKDEIFYQSDLPSGPVDLALDPDGRLFCAFFGQGAILVLDRDGNLRETIKTPGMLPTSIAVSPGGLFVSDMEQGNVIRLQ